MLLLRGIITHSWFCTSDAFFSSFNISNALTKIILPTNLKNVNKYLSFTLNYHCIIISNFWAKSYVPWYPKSYHLINPIFDVIQLKSIRALVRKLLVFPNNTEKLARNMRLELIVGIVWFYFLLTSDCWHIGQCRQIVMILHLVSVHTIYWP